MKKTMHFISKIVPWDDPLSATNDVVAQRDEFIDRNKKMIEDIANEEIKFETSNGYQGGHPRIFAILSLTYYLKL